MKQTRRSEETLRAVPQFMFRVESLFTNDVDGCRFLVVETDGKTR